MDLETRELRYFRAVAEEGHVGRAAQRLQMTQAPLSRAIQQLERRLGVTLFERHTRGVTLTMPGRVLLAESRAALDATAAAVNRTRRAASVRPQLVIATKAAGNHRLLRGLLDTYSGDPDAAEVHVELCGPAEQLRMLDEGRADAAIMHQGYDRTAGLETQVLELERQVAILPVAHPLAARTTLSFGEVQAVPDLPLARCELHDGSAAPGPGPEVHDLAQLAELVALGRALAVLPASATDWLWPQHAVVPIEDAPPVTTVIAWPARGCTPALAGLLRAASRLTAPEPALA